QESAVSRTLRSEARVAELSRRCTGCDRIGNFRALAGACGRGTARASIRESRAMSDTKFDYYAAAKNAPHAERDDHAGHTHASSVEHDDGPPSEYEIMSRAMQELLEEKGVITAEEVRRRMEIFEEDFPYRGSRVVARAWSDPQFKQRLLEDGKAACAEMGIDLEAERLIAVENTPDVHNIIV